VEYSKTLEGTGLLTMWALAPWAWLTQGAAVWTMLGLSAFTLAAGASEGNGHPPVTCPGDR